jgi:RimJ/RimL family protein N-acetyltransferase
MESAYTVRRLEPAEAGAYRAIRLEALARAADRYQDLLADEAALPRLPLEELVASGTDEGFVMGAFHEGSLIGIAGFLRERKPKRRHCGSVVHVFVDPAHQGRRMGRRLVRAVIESAFALDGVERLELGVLAGNRAAVKSYEALGFAIAGRQEKFLKHGEHYWDRLVMQLFKPREAPLAPADPLPCATRPAACRTGA